jgi:hypothetical protein
MERGRPPLPTVESTNIIWIVAADLPDVSLILTNTDNEKAYLSYKWKTGNEADCQCNGE